MGILNKNEIELLDKYGPELEKINEAIENGRSCGEELDEFFSSINAEDTFFFWVKFSLILLWDLPITARFVERPDGLEELLLEAELPGNETLFISFCLYQGVKPPTVISKKKALYHNGREDFGRCGDGVFRLFEKILDKAVYL